MTNNGVLQVAHSIFKRWQPLYRTDELYTEINHVLSKFGAPFLSLVEVNILFKNVPISQVLTDGSLDRAPIS